MEYITCLVLAYFKEKKANYSISELSELLGYDNARVEDLLYRMIANGLLHYVDNLLVVSQKGLTFLISRNYEDVNMQCEEYVMPHICPDKALTQDAPYVPKGFSKKYKG